MFSEVLYNLSPTINAAAAAAAPGTSAAAGGSGTSAATGGSGAGAGDAIYCVQSIKNIRHILRNRSSNSKQPHKSWVVTKTHECNVGHKSITDVR